MKKRILSIVLPLCMVRMLVPTTALPELRFTAKEKRLNKT